MKQILLYLSAFFSISSYGQIEIINKSLADSSLNLLYIGVENYIEIKSQKKLKGAQLTITGAAGNLTRLNDEKFVLRVNSTESCTLSIFQNGKILKKKLYQIKAIPYPIATLNGIKDTTISKSKFLINPILSIVFPNCYYRSYLQIISFQATFIKGGDSTFTLARHSHLSEEQIKLAKQLSTGSKVYFDGIRARGPDSRTITLNPFWIRIE